MKRILLFFMFSMGLATLAQAQQTPAPAKDTILQQFVGKYVFPEGSVVPDVTVAIEEGALVMASTQGNSALEKQSDDLYTIVQFQGTAKFNRDAGKKITGVSINAMGYQLEGTKEETKTMASANIKKYQNLWSVSDMVR